jgi:hypothetical protein
MPLPLSDEESKKTEKEIGAELSSSYRKRRMIDNGGFVKVRGEEWQLFPIRDQSSRKLISRTLFKSRIQIVNPCLVQK